MLKLTIRTDGGRISGSLIKPHDLRIDRDGTAARTGGVEITMPIQKAALKPGRLQLTIDGDDLIVTTEKYGALLMRMEGIQPWRPGRPLPRGEDADSSFA
jgi:hypothetical protein